MKQFWVVGHPIDHSLSPLIHQSFASQFGLTISYEKRLLELGAFASEMRTFFASGGAGANVTVPFKGDAFEFAHEAVGDAVWAQAVNTLVPLPDGRLQGHNTDGAGLVGDLHRLGFGIEGRRVLLLGAGGAVRGVLPALTRAKPARLVLANRTVDKAEALAGPLNGVEVTAVGLHDDAALGAGWDLVINATSAGLSGEALPVSVETIAGAQCYDMIYGAGAAFYRSARDLGLPAADGLGMLVGQAAEAFALWHGLQPELEPVIEQLGDSVG